MDYSGGMGLELPVWIIQTVSGSKSFNRKTKKFQTEATVDCIFHSDEEARTELKSLDFGYVVRKRRHYQDAKNSRIS